MYLSIIIPAYNEKRRILRTLARVNYYIRKNNIDAEVIVVDDGSRDNTYSLCSDFASRKENIKVLRNDRNRGKGFSVRRGTLMAKGDYILFSDADNSTPIQEVRKLLPYVDGGGFDIVIGSRSIKGAEVKLKQPFFRIFMGKIFNRLVCLFLYNDFVDTQCGFKCFSRKAAREVFAIQKFRRFSFDIEILAIAKLKGYRIKEVPIVWVNSLNSRVNPIKDASQMFLDIFRLKGYLRHKIYG